MKASNIETTAVGELLRNMHRSIKIMTLMTCYDFQFEKSTQKHLNKQKSYVLHVRKKSLRLMYSTPPCARARSTSRVRVYAHRRPGVVEVQYGC